jgi:4-hydroxy-2-oxoheptanedioate aldolase
VQAAITDGIEAVRVAGKAAGILTSDQKFASQCLQLGALFVAVGVDTMLLVRAASTLAQVFKESASCAAPAQDSTY